MRPAARLVQPGEQRQQRRFAGARGADDRDGFSGGDREVDFCQNGQRSFRAANLFGDLFRSEDRLRNAHVAFCDGASGRQLAR